MYKNKKISLLFLIVFISLLACAGCQDHYTDNSADELIDTSSLGGLRCAPCGEPPPDTCVGPSLVSYMEVGFCEETDPSLCRYSPFSVRCGANQICRGGACADTNTPSCAGIVLDGVLDPATTTHVGSMLGATDDITSPCGYYDTPDITLMWSPPSDGCYTINTMGSAFDTVLDVRRCDDGYAISCNDEDIGGSGTALLHFDALAAEAYAITVEGYEFAISSDFVLNISPCAPCSERGCEAPPFDTCSDRNTMRFYDYYGSCDDETGLCNYSFTDIPCDVSQPASCEGDTLITYAALGICDASSGYPVCQAAEPLSRVNCADLGQFCFAGACRSDLPRCSMSVIDADLDPSTTTHTGSTAGTTNDYASQCGAGYGSPDQAFVWSPPSDGCYVFDTRGSTFDTMLDVYLCAGGYVLACDDDAGGDLSSRIMLDVSASESYVIVVDAYLDNVSGNFTLNINPCAACENVECYTPPADTCSNLNTMRFYDYYGYCDDTTGTCNYSFTEDYCDTPPLPLCAGNFLTTYAPTGTCHTSFGYPTCEYAPLGRVDCASVGQFCYAGACVDEIPACMIDTDVTLSADTTTYSGSTVGVSNDISTSCANTFDAPDLTFAWSPPFDGCYTIDTQGSTFDTVLEVRNCADGYPLICDDDGGANNSSRLTLYSAFTSETYAIIVDGFGSNSGDFNLHINPCSPCDGAACYTPPPATCADNAIRTFDDYGTCSVGSNGLPTCTYPSVDDLCDTPPSASCEGNTLTTYAPLGVCDNSQDFPVCRYALAESIDCAARNQVCFAGACLDEAPVCRVGALDGILSAETTRYVGSTSSLSDDFASDCGGYGSPDIALVWSPTVEGCYTIDTQGSTFDTTLEAQRCDDATVVTCNDDYNSSSSLITLYVTAGEVYTLIVDGFSYHSGDFVLNINPCF